MPPKCPFCDREQIRQPTRRWLYRKYVVVSQFACECGKYFRFYESQNKSWTIPKKPSKPQSRSRK